MKHPEYESTHTRAKLQWLKAHMVEVLIAPVGDEARTLDASGSTLTKAWDNAASREDQLWHKEQAPQLTQSLKQMTSHSSSWVKASQCWGTKEGFLPCRHTGHWRPLLSLAGQRISQPSEALPHCPEPAAPPATRAGTQRAHPTGWDTGQDTAQPAEPLPQQWWHSRRKASVQIPAGCHTAAN